MIDRGRAIEKDREKEGARERESFRFIFCSWDTSVLHCFDILLFNLSLDVHKVPERT